MRKVKIWRAIMTIIIGAMVGLHLNLNTDTNNIAVLTLDNIEALASSEDDTVHGVVECVGSGSLYCYITNKSIYKSIYIYQ